jgi:small ubiquitin-related modifier
VDAALGACVRGREHVGSLQGNLPSPIVGSARKFALGTVFRVRNTMSLEEIVVKAAEAAVDAAIEATALSGDAFGERLEAMAAKLSAAARAGVKKARAEAKARKEAEPAPKRAKAKPKPGSFVNFYVKDLRGKKTTFKIENATKLEAVLDTYAEQASDLDEGLLPLRYIFKGHHIRPDQTPQDIDMDDGDTIHLVPNMRGSIGIFGDHAGSHGLAFLQPGAKLDDAPAAVVREIAARCRLGGSEGDTPYFASFPAAGLLSAAQRAALRAELDLGARGALDFKKPLTRREASSRLGAKVYASLEALFRSHGGRVDKIVLRRSAAVGQCIKFHTDVDHKTFQLCLNDDFDGGDLVFAADDKLVKPRRPAGSFTVHNDRIAHGVSTLERGARYALFFLMRAP